MTTLFQVCVDSDFGDCMETSFHFNSLNQDSAISFAKNLFALKTKNYGESERPNLMALVETVKHFKNPKANRITYTFSVIATSLDTDLTAEKSTCVWTPSLDDVYSLVKNVLIDLVSFDVKTTLSDNELDELLNLFMTDQEIFREKKYYGITRNIGEMLIFLNSNQKEILMDDIKKSI